MNKLITPISSIRNSEEFEEVALPQGFKASGGIAGRLLAAQEEERKRISRDLHDEMNQRIAVLCFQVQSLQTSFLPSSEPHQALQKLYDELALLSDDIRRFAHQLHPSILRDLGLSQAIQSLVHEVGKREGISMALEDKITNEPLPEEVACCGYRLAQEALQNIVKHAQASCVRITMEQDSKEVRLSIVDDGQGFEPNHVHSQTPGLGLVGMMERVQLLGGQIRIKSAPGKGTAIQAFLPLKKKRMSFTEDTVRFPRLHLFGTQSNGSASSLPKKRLKSKSPVGALVG